MTGAKPGLELPETWERRPSLARLPRIYRPDGSRIRVLVVDDEPTLTSLVSLALQYEDWTTITAPDGEQGLEAFRTHQPDLVVLDIMLPDIDGVTLLRRMRELDDPKPVLFLTAKDSVDDRIIGLTAGGDDYMTKPFSLEELVARLRGLLRRYPAQPMESGDTLVVGDLVLDSESYEVKRAGQRIALTTTEFELLRFLMRNARHVVSRSQILDRVWKYDFGGKASVVDIYISYLRRKIDLGREPMIHTVRGVGYVLRPAE